MTSPVQHCKSAKWKIAAALVCAVAEMGSAQTGGATSDARAILSQQIAQLQGRPGKLVLDQRATLNGSFNVPAGDALAIQAPLQVAAGATIHLGGHNDIRCAAPVTVAGRDLFIAEGVSDVSVSDCEVTGHGGYLLTAARSARVSLNGNRLTDMAVLTTAGSGPGAASTNVNVTGNSTTYAHGGGDIGVYLVFVQGGTVTNNHFDGNGHGVEWWGGNANGEWHSPAQVNGTGQFTVSGNTCHAIGGACIWGSMGARITISNNSADGCGDVCFDTEGGVDNVFTGNQAKNCNFGCLAAEFESDGTVFRGNTASGSDGKAMVLIKHGPGYPYWHTRLVIDGNTLTCTQQCPAIYTEGDDGLTFSRNIITNGVFQTVNYQGDTRVIGNQIRFTRPPGNLPVIGGPALFMGRTSEISGNTVVNQAAVTPGSVCIAQSWSDFNAADTMRIERNTCQGFATGIVTETAGQNPGAPHAIWVVQGNAVRGATTAFVHRRTSGNDVYTGQR